MLIRIFQQHCATQRLYDFVNRTILTSAKQFKSIKSRIDRSKVPTLNNDDLEVRYVRGSGPGGQSTNKTSNNVVMKHLPTGIVVKCHETRSQTQNLKIAEEKLINKLDLLYNGEYAVENQEKRLLLKKSLDKKRRQKKRAAMKEALKEDNEETEENDKKDT